jgi:undecaprenyl-diphosphatase
MSWWEAVILGLVDGITEYLPVSSTGHLILTTELMRFPADIRPHADAYTIVIQGGAILAVLGLYFGRVRQMVMGLLGKDPVGLKLATNIIIAFIPAVILGLLFEDLIDRYLFSTWPVLGMLVLGGVWMIWIDRWRKRHLKDEAAEGVDPEQSRFSITIEQLDWKRALGIGLFQCVAMIPGTSRSMMTIAGGTVLGMKPKDAAEFSFLLGLPTLGGACLYKLYGNVTEAAERGEPNMFEALGAMPVVIGVVVSLVSALLAVKWLVSFLNTHGLSPFGYYRIALAVVLGGLVLGGIVNIDGDEAAVEGVVDDAGAGGSDAPADASPGDQA